MRKLIVFDLFGVVIDSHSKIKYNLNCARLDIANFCNLKKDTLLKFFEDDRFGVTSNEEFKNLIQEYIDIDKSKSTVQDFIEIYKVSYGKISCYQNVIKFIEELQKQNLCETAILSKLCVLDKPFIEKNLKLKNFNYLFLSCDLGLEKPDLEVYKYVEKVSGFKSNEILFIDDNKNNIEAAKKMGWETCLATGDELDKINMQCKSFLRK